MKKQEKKIYGLIGYPLDHSFSKEYFTKKFSEENIDNVTYQLFSIPSINLLESILQENPDICGLNVTIPYKKEIISKLDFIDDEAEKAGAVNTIKITTEQNKKILTGYNTDIFGFEQSLKLLPSNFQKGALILGNGGASAAVSYCLKKLKIPYMLVSRKQTIETICYNQINETHIHNFPFIINTTPMGMYPNTEQFPAIPYQIINENNIVYDLIYNPEETLFLNKCRKQGAFTINGLNMLYLQANRSWEIWKNKS